MNRNCEKKKKKEIVFQHSPGYYALKLCNKETMTKATEVYFEKTGQLIKDFIDYLNYDRRMSSATASAYISDLSQMMEFWKKEQKPTTPLSLQDICKKFSLSLFYNKNLSPQTISRKLSSIKTFKKFLQKQGLTLEFEVKNPKVKKKLPTVIEKKDLSFLLDELECEKMNCKFPLRDKAILELLYSTGVRCNELVNIKTSDIDFGDKFIKIIKGKGEKERLVVFGEFAKKALSRYCENERKAMQKGIVEYLFLNNDGMKMTTRTVQRVLENFRKFLPEEENLTPHTLRHSFATHMLSAGACLRAVQELLGHSNLLTTELYTQISQTQMAEFLEENHPLQKFAKGRCNDPAHE